MDIPEPVREFFDRRRPERSDFRASDRNIERLAMLCRYVRARMTVEDALKRVAREEGLTSKSSLATLTHALSVTFHLSEQTDRAPRIEAYQDWKRGAGQFRYRPKSDRDPGADPSPKSPRKTDQPKPEAGPRHPDEWKGSSEPPAAEFPDPLRLGLYKAFEIVSAPPGRTFFYRNEHRRIIELGWHDDDRLRAVNGPLVYVVTDCTGTVRYVGKWVTDTPLRARWFRHGQISHIPSLRNRIIEEIDRRRVPLAVWSASAFEIRRMPLPESAQLLTNRELVERLESLWIHRWRPQLWNKAHPRPVPGFTDGEYWERRPEP
jgi:hypothetical protein